MVQKVATHRVQRCREEREQLIQVEKGYRIYGVTLFMDKIVSEVRKKEMETGTHM